MSSRHQVQQGKETRRVATKELHQRHQVPAPVLRPGDCTDHHQSMQRPVDCIGKQSMLVDGPASALKCLDRAGPQAIQAHGFNPTPGALFHTQHSQQPLPPLPLRCRMQYTHPEQHTLRTIPFPPSPPHHYSAEHGTHVHLLPPPCTPRHKQYPTPATHPEDPSADIRSDRSASVREPVAASWLARSSSSAANAGSSTPAWWT